MAAGVGPGDGTTLTFAGNTYVPTNISFDGASVASIGTGGLGVVADTARVYTAGNIVDWGTLTVDVEFDGSQDVPTLGGDAVAVSIVVRGVVADTLSTTGYIENWSFNIPQGDKMTGTMVIRLASALAQAA